MNVNCAHCGTTVFTITGWADWEHCSGCGRRLAVGNPNDALEETMGEKEPMRERAPDRLSTFDLGWSAEDSKRDAPKLS